MRINLATPFAEKDAVKALGARWDVTKKCWYITNVADLTPFARWIPNLDAAGDKSEEMLPAKKPRLMPLIPALASDSGAADCGCNVLPWEDCVHTAKALPT